jgi:hypothetical protein
LFLTCRSSRRNHTAGTSEALAKSLVLMIFVGLRPFREAGSGNVVFLFTDRRMSARWRVAVRNEIAEAVNGTRKRIRV